MAKKYLFLLLMVGFVASLDAVSCGYFVGGSPFYDSMTP